MNEKQIKDFFLSIRDDSWIHQDLSHLITHHKDLCFYMSRDVAALQQTAYFFNEAAQVLCDLITDLSDEKSEEELLISYNMLLYNLDQATDKLMKIFFKPKEKDNE